MLPAFTHMLNCTRNACATRDSVERMLRLYYYPGNASLAPHMLLRELNVPFELQLVDRKHDAQHSAEYLRLNPNGRIPTLVDGELVLWETAAICLHLLDRYPEPLQTPAPGTAPRAQLYKWLAWLSATLQPELMVSAYPERWSSRATAEVAASAERHIDEMFDLAEAALDPYLLGSRFSAADLYFLMLCRWSRKLQKPASSRPKTARLVAELLERPAVRATFEAEGLTPPKRTSP
jgi:glutathione S-transferase